MDWLNSTLRITNSRKWGCPMWYFNGSNFSSAEEREFRLAFNRAVLEISDEYEVMFPEGEYEWDNPLFSGYEILVQKNEGTIKRIDAFETGNWIIYGGQIEDHLRRALNSHLEGSRIFSIKLISGGKDLFEINDFDEYLIHDDEVLKGFHAFRDIQEL